MEFSASKSEEEINEIKNIIDVFHSTYSKKVKKPDVLKFLKIDTIREEFKDDFLELLEEGYDKYKDNLKL